MSKRSKIKGITWLIQPPYLHKPTDDKNRKDIELRIDDDPDKAYSYIAKYHRIDVSEVMEAFRNEGEA